MLPRMENGHVPSTVACQNEIRGRTNKKSSNFSRLPRPSSRHCLPSLSLASLQILLPPTDPRDHGPHPSHHPSAIGPASLPRPPRSPLLFYFTLLHSLAFGCCWLVPFLRVARTPETQLGTSSSTPQGEREREARGGEKGGGRQPQ